MAANSPVTDTAHLAADAAVGKAGLGATLAGSATAVYGGYSLNEWAMLLGAVAAVGGLLLTAYTTMDARAARRRKERRDEEWHLARMAAFARDPSLDTDNAPLFEESRESIQ